MGRTLGNENSITTALKVSSEGGLDLWRFKSARHLASWVGLCPETEAKISRGKPLAGTSKRTANRAAQGPAPRGGGLRSRRSALTEGAEYADREQDYYEEGYRQRVMHHLTKRAKQLGRQLTPIAPAV